MKLHNNSESGDDAPLRVLGIDPGSRITGFGVIAVYGNQLACVDRGCIRTGDGEFPARLQQIFSGISAVIDRHQPQQVAIEDVFVGRNVASALKLGQARGVAMGACLSQQLPVAEYAARQVKQAVTGTGAAGKEQVQHMVKVLLSISDSLAEDAADALAVAICHAHTSAGLMRLAGASSFSRKRLR